MVARATPRFIHDCDGCQFLGLHGDFDVYYCARCDHGSWIARYGDNGPEYASYPEFVFRIHSPVSIEQSASMQAIDAYRDRLTGEPAK